MAEAGTLHDAFIDELRDTYDAEKQLTKALPKLAKAASNPKLRQAFESHLQETQGQIARLEKVFASCEKGARQALYGIAGIIEKASDQEEDFDERRGTMPDAGGNVRNTTRWPASARSSRGRGTGTPKPPSFFRRR